MLMFPFKLFEPVHVGLFVLMFMFFKLWRQQSGAISRGDIMGEIGFLVEPFQNSGFFFCYIHKFKFTNDTRSLK